MGKLNASEPSVIPIEDIKNYGKRISDKDFVTNLYFKICGTEKTMSGAYFKAQICTPDGSQVPQFYVDHNYKSTKQVVSKPINEAFFYNNSFFELIHLIQAGELGKFPKITMFAQERSIEYDPNKEHDNYPHWMETYRPDQDKIVQGPHYYLDLIVGTPGKKVKMAKSVRPIKACADCDAALLKYTYDWVLQRDDLSQKDCPYCGKPLKIIERERKYVPIELDFKAKDLRISGINNQIGVIYHGVPIKITIKLAAMRNLLMNYQNLFFNGALGPFQSSFNITNSRKGFTTIQTLKHIEFGLKEIEWRPVTLFPEDLISY